MIDYEMGVYFFNSKNSDEFKITKKKNNKLQQSGALGEGMAKKREKRKKKEVKLKKKK
jgi:hypothetical protein